MAIDNRISLTITSAHKTAITDAVAALKTALTGLTINLTAEERHTPAEDRGSHDGLR